MAGASQSPLSPTQAFNSGVLGIRLSLLQQPPAPGPKLPRASNPHSFNCPSAPSTHPHPLTPTPGSLTASLGEPTSLQPQLYGPSPSSSTTTEPSPTQGPHFHGTSADRGLLAPCPSLTVTFPLAHHRAASFGGQARLPEPHAPLSPDTYITLPPSRLPLALHSNSQETAGSRFLHRRLPRDALSDSTSCPGPAHTGTLSSLWHHPLIAATLFHLQQCPS